MKIVIGNDHAGFSLKEKLKDFFAGLIKKGYSIKDLGTYNEESVDYPDFARIVAESVKTGESDFGILMCGSGNGINMSANKYPGIRSALCWNEEIAKLARQHNDANVLAMPARFLKKEEAEKIIETFLKEKFEGGRHQKRVEKIDNNSK